MAEPVSAAAAASSMVPEAVSAGSSLLSTAFNAFMAERQMDFQRNMANTSHQREVKDLRAAGLNPILSAKHGGAAVPAGASAQAAQDRTAETLLQSRLQAEQLELIRAQTRDANSAAALKDVQANDVNATQAERINTLIADVYAKLQSGNLSGSQRDQALQQIKNLQAQRELIISQTAHSAAQLHKEQVKGKLWEHGQKVIEAVKKPPQHPGQFDWKKFQKPGKTWFERNIYKKPERR